MQALTAKATKETAAVKVITIVTLVYLPTTAVLVGPSLQVPSSLARADQMCLRIFSLRPSSIIPVIKMERLF
jgi:hypothetical protein